MKTNLKQKLLIAGIVGLLALALVGAVFNWQPILSVLVVAFVAGIAIASLTFLPAFCYYLVVTRSINTAVMRATELWVRIAAAVFSEISSR